MRRQPSEGASPNPPPRAPKGARATHQGDTTVATTAVKNTAEQFTAAGNKAFKDSVEKSMAALGELNTHSKKNLEAVVASVTAATKGAETLGARAIAFSKKSVEDHVAAAKSFAGAKSLQEV